MAPKPTISLCMITKDEEEFLRNCLESVKEIVDEIIIVDTGSKDNTTKIAKEFGAKVIEHKWNDNFSEARNISLKHATKDWILVLDADETISKKDHKKIQLLIAKDFEAYTLIQRNYYSELKPLTFEVTSDNDDYEESKNYKGWFPSELVRLFKNKKEYKFSGMIHELIEPSIKDQKRKIGKSNIPIHHFRVDKSEEFDQEKTEKYLKIGKEQIKQTPDNPKPYFEVGSIYFAQEDYSKAIEYFKKSAELIGDTKNVEHHSTYVYVYFNLGKSYMKTEQFKKAIDCFEKVIGIVPNTPLSYFFLGQANASLGNFKRAIDAYEQAGKLDPKDSEIFNNLANAYANLDQFENALKNFKKALELDPKNATIHRNVGAISLGAKKYASAYFHFKRAVELEPSFRADLQEVIKRLEPVKDQLDVDYSFSIE